MNKSFCGFLMALILFISACGGGNAAVTDNGSSTALVPAEQASVASSESASGINPEVESKESETKQPSGNEKIYPDNRVILYRFIADSELYDTTKLLEVKDGAKFGDIFNIVVEEMFPNIDVPTIHSVAMSKSCVFCNFGEDWLDTFNKGQLYEFCNTLTMTLQKNGFCESVSFMIDGKTGLLGGETWECAELKVLEGASADECADIRASIPYGGLKQHGADSYFDFAKTVKKDDMAEKIHRVLKFAGELINEFDHPSEMDMENAVQNLIWCTEPIDIAPDSEYYDVKIAQQLIPITSSVSQRLAFQENCFWLKEHIEESAYEIFGADVVIKHCEPRMPYKWFETEGVYTPPHMGGGWNIIPHLYSYTVDAENKTVTAEVAYLRNTMQGIYDAVQDKFMEDYDDIEEYLQNRAQRHIVMLRTEADGRLTIRQHHLV
ncbi:MAG: hypothetical protein II995_02815 [Oscillospiraceae bacterium]|nr:hypothetical protein [Oscillospiraceae bacterium]